MELAKRTVRLAILLGGIGALAAALAGSMFVAVGILLGCLTGVLSILSIMLLTTVVTASDSPQRGRNWAVLWMLVKLPILGGLVVLAGRLGSDASGSFVWSIGSVYSLLLCLGLLAARRADRDSSADSVTAGTSQDDT